MRAVADGCERWVEATTCTGRVEAAEAPRTPTRIARLYTLPTWHCILPQPSPTDTPWPSSPSCMGAARMVASLHTRSTLAAAPRVPSCSPRAPRPPHLARAPQLSARASPSTRRPARRRCWCARRSTPPHAESPHACTPQRWWLPSQVGETPRRGGCPTWSSLRSLPECEVQCNAHSSPAIATHHQANRLREARGFPPPLGLRLRVRWFSHRGQAHHRLPRHGDHGRPHDPEPASGGLSGKWSLHRRREGPLHLCVLYPSTSRHGPAHGGMRFKGACTMP